VNQLTVSQLHAQYGKAKILRGVEMQLEKGNISCLLGRNGSGRSTMLKAMMGIVRPTSGEVMLTGVNLAGMSPDRVAKMGLAYVPEDRLVFAHLTVEENLRVGTQSARRDANKWSFDDMFAYFPRLKDRITQKAGTLSGGEQQMLTLCRSLLGNPYVILVDEPTEGLAPLIVEALRDVLIDIARKGVTVLLVEQKLALALKVSRRVFVMGHGKIVFTGDVEEFRSRQDIRREWLDVA
jgi:branched-chain amino acid transport system ATP-binding protein